MGQQQQKMKMFNSSTATSQNKDQPLFVNTSNIGSRSAVDSNVCDSENRQNNNGATSSAFHTFLKMAPTKSWVSAIVLDATPQIPHKISISCPSLFLFTFCFHSIISFCHAWQLVYAAMLFFLLFFPDFSDKLKWMLILLFSFSSSSFWTYKKSKVVCGRRCNSGDTKKSISSCRIRKSNFSLTSFWSVDAERFVNCSKK